MDRKRIQVKFMILKETVVLDVALIIARYLRDLDMRNPPISQVYNNSCSAHRESCLCSKEKPFFPFARTPTYYPYPRYR